MFVYAKKTVNIKAYPRKNVYSGNDKMDYKEIFNSQIQLELSYTDNRINRSNNIPQKKRPG